MSLNETYIVKCVFTKTLEMLTQSVGVNGIYSFVPNIGTKYSVMLNIRIFVRFSFENVVKGTI